MTFSRTLRAAAAGALSLALFASGAANAFAAPGDPLNPQTNGSKGSFYLYDANSGALADNDTTRVYTRDEMLIASASSADVLAEINPAATRPVTGATLFTGVYRFISDKTPAAVAGGTATWKAHALDTAQGPNGGTMVADFTLNAFVNGINAVIGTGGSFWYGVAYTTNNGVTTIGAVYREINITAGTGSYTVGAVEVEAAAATDVATTTALVASAPAVTTGGSTILTATVSAPGKTVSGNVQFLEGSTVLGTVALSAGTASKSVAVSPAGAHNYTATFVENTVGSDKFLASTSTAVTVTATDAPPPVVPNAPSENSLNLATANGATAVYTVADHKATLTVPASINGKVVNTFVYSTPIFLGEVTVAAGTISFDVSVLPAGDHKMVIVDKANGDVLAWATFTKTDAAIAPSFSKTINADVANGTGTPADGEFSLTNLSGSTVNLVNPALVNGASIVSGQLGDFKVTDMRVVTKAGWTLKTDVAQFAKGTDTIANSALGIDPKVVSQTAGTAPVMGAAQVSGSAVYPWNFATLAAGSYSGVSTYNADLVFTAPVGSPAGTYTSTLTLTLVSN